ncbi:MAG: Gfo/Idh/MocA family protein [Phycisphaerae bacterium]
MNVAIVGCGNIGRKRAKALGKAKLVACSDVILDKAKALAATAAGAEAVSDWRAAVERKDVEAVIVATTHDMLSPVTLAAARAAKHVLVEKPAGRTVAEIDPLIEAAKRYGVLVRVGFNHRYHPAVLKAREIVASGALGEMMFLRGRYGHGGRIGYDKEWRADPKISGGGELIDQGVHLIDLARLFLGDIVHVEGFAHTYYWKMPVDDNAFLLLRTADDKAALLHASCTEWKNMFSLEIYGKGGKLDISGLGGSYGTERLTFYRMLPEMGPPETTSWEYPMGDRSWSLELEEFLDDIQLGREPSAGLGDARAAIEVVQAIYGSKRP